MGSIFKIFSTGASAQARAAKKAYELQEKQYQQSVEAQNAQNAKEADVDTIKSENEGGISSTMLSGVGGVDADELNSKTKKKSLLGGS